MNKTKSKKTSRGFTLVELMIVMSIIGVLTAIGVGSFMTAQQRGRDAERKSDLKQISHALELFYADYGKYPNASGTAIAACAYDPASGTGSACSWGSETSSGTFTDGKTVYFKNLPMDPTPASSYTYKIVAGSSNQKFQLFAKLENTQDKDCISNDCTTNPNFAITSANTNPSE